MNSAGYKALRENAAWIDLGARGKILARGEDRVRLLHAMTTNHVQQLVPGDGLYAFFLSAQGRIVTDVRLFCVEEFLLLDTEPEMRARLLEHLDRFIIADDVTLEDASEALSSLSVEGPHSREALRAAGIPVPARPYVIEEWEDGFAAGCTATGSPGAMLFVNRARREKVIETLRLDEAGPEAAEAVRIQNGFPRYGVDFTEANIPQETQLDGALHFSKGCYLGQEIVERVRSRGHVNRLLSSFQVEGNAVRGQKLLLNGKEAGEITSAAPMHPEDRTAALGILRAEALASGLTTDQGAPVTEVKRPSGLAGY